MKKMNTLFLTIMSLGIVCSTATINNFYSNNNCEIEASEPYYDLTSKKGTNRSEAFPIATGEKAGSKGKFEDKYEPNNSIANAKKIETTYNKTSALETFPEIEGTLGYQKWYPWGQDTRYVDEDIFYFDTKGKGEIKINLTFSENHSFRVGLYNSPSKVDETIEDIIKYGNYHYSTTPKGKKGVSELKMSLTYASRYYLRVFSSVDGDDYSVSSDDKYKLNIDFKYENPEVEISELRYNQGALGAVVISDAYSFGAEAFKIDEPLKFFNDSTDDPGNHFYDSMYDKETPYADFYVWDTNLRTTVYETFKNLTAAIRTKKDDILKKKEFVINLVKVGEEIGDFATNVGYVLTISGLEIPAAVAGVTSTVCDIGCKFFERFLPTEITENYNSLISYLEKICIALECDPRYEHNEVIKISCGYKIYQKWERPFLISYYRGDMLEYVPVSNNDKFVYREDTIKGKVGDLYGTIFPIRNSTDFKNACKRSTYTAGWVNTGGDEELTFDNPGHPILAYGQYAWYHFTAQKPGMYCFYTMGNLDTTISVYKTLVVNQKNPLFSDDNTGMKNNARIDLYIEKDETYYFCVKSKSRDVIESISFNVKNSINGIVLKGNTFGFREEYTKTVEKNVVDCDGYSYSTERLRCGFIIDNYLVISCNRAGYGNAYFDISTPYAFNAFSIDMAIWSDSEGIDTKGTLTIAAMGNSTDEIEKMEIKIKDLSHAKENLDKIDFQFGFDARAIRITVTTTNPTGSKNHGRVVLDNLTFNKVD